MWEMQGELGTSHCYEFGGDYRQPPRYPIGLLGADFRWDAKAKGQKGSGPLDELAAYAARWVAKHVVEAGLAERAAS